MLFVRRLYLPLLLVLCALWAFSPIEGGDDFWAHAAIGRIVLDEGHVPKSTVYLWSADVPWVFHAYGSGIIYAALLNIGGAWLALCLNFALAVAPLLLVWRRARERAGEVPLLLVALFVPALWFASVRWRLRPEGFTVLFLTLLLLFLSAQKRERWHYVVITAMFALWPNLHGGVLIGILILWTAVVSQASLPLVSRLCVVVINFPGALIARAWAAFVRKPRETTSEKYFSVAPASPIVTQSEPRFDFRLIGLAALCSLLPLVCNPWGLAYRTVFAGTAATSNHISEWRHFWAFPKMSMEVAWGLCALWVVAFVVWCLDREKRAVVGGALLLVGALWLQARRQLWVTSATCMVALAQSAPLLEGQRLYTALKRGLLKLMLFARRALRRDGEDLKIALERQNEARLDMPMQIIAEAGVLLILVCACIVNLPTRGLRAISKTAPIPMSQFLTSPGAPKGRIFNDYEYSAALEWFLEDKRKLSIDLINAYPPKLFDDWFEVAHASDAGLKWLDNNQVDVIALRPIDQKNEDDPIFKLGKYLEVSPAWKQRYKGLDGRVWARKKPFNAPEAPNPPVRPIPETTPD